MKKLFAIVLAVAMIAAMAVIASADPISTLGTQNKDVTATFNNRNPHTAVYSINLSWGSMAFTYSSKIDEWDASAHKWNPTTAAGWTCESGADKITVASDSSVPVKATFAYAAAQGNTIAGAFSVNAAQASAWNAETDVLTVPVAEENVTATNYVVTLALTGELANNWQAGAKLGAVTITLA